MQFFYEERKKCISTKKIVIKVWNPLFYERNIYNRERKLYYLTSNNLDYQVSYHSFNRNCPFPPHKYIIQAEAPIFMWFNIENAF